MQALFKRLGCEVWPACVAFFSLLFLDNLLKSVSYDGEGLLEDKARVVA